MEPKTDNGLSAEAQAFVAKSIADALAPIADALKRKATDNMGGGSPDVKADGGAGLPDDRETFTGRNVKSADEGSGIGLARWVKAMAVAKMRGESPEAVAKAWKYHRLAKSFAETKALSQGVFADGGAVVPHEIAADFIGLLRNVTVIRKAGARSVPMGASMEVPKQTGGGTAYWGEENTTITESQQTFGSVRLAEKKLTALTKISNDMIRNASLSAEEFVRDDLLNVIGIAEDLALLRGSGSVSEPKGLRNQLAAAHVYAETITTPGSPSLSELKKELNKALRKLRDAKMPMTRVAWLFPPRVEQALLDAVGPGGEGYNSLEREMVERGTLRGFPYFVTTQIPENTGGGTDTELYVADFDQVVIGDSMDLELLVFPNGGDSGITKDQTTVRAIKKMDLAARHDKCGVCVQDISWGA